MAQVFKQQSEVAFSPTTVGFVLETATEMRSLRKWLHGLNVDFITQTLQAFDTDSFDPVEANILWGIFMELKNQIGDPLPSDLQPIIPPSPLEEQTDI